jgi:hypothetical protein
MDVPLCAAWDNPIIGPAFPPSQAAWLFKFSVVAVMSASPLSAAHPSARSCHV